MLPPSLPPFRDPALLYRALTHRSYLNEHPEVPEDNERLEFLGDAVLDFVSGAFLYNRYPEMHEGQLTRLRSALVKEKPLAAFAEQLGIGPLLRLGKGEEETGGRQREAMLADTFEAIIGAYYLDSGIEAVIRYIEPLFLSMKTEMIHTADHLDPKSAFQEWAQANKKISPRYYIVNSSGPEHIKEFVVEVRLNDEVYGVGTGRSKRVATQAAALDALKRLGLA